MTQTFTKPNVPATEALYDWIMGHVEPELVRANLQGLDAKYAAETPEQKAARAERYNRAFAEYERLLAEYLHRLNAQVNTYKRVAYQTMEDLHRSEDADVMTDLFAIISAS